MRRAIRRQNHAAKLYRRLFCILPSVATQAVQTTLTRARAVLERGRGADATQLLQPLHHTGALAIDDAIAVREALTEGWLLQDDLTRAAAALGRLPDTYREPLTNAQRSTLWRLHGRLTFARGEQSRAIALHTRALKDAELARDSRLIGLAHYELALGYKQVGDFGIVNEHLTQAASALHAAGDRRHLALVHRLSAVLLAQSGRVDDAAATLRSGERLASAIQADDVLAGIVHNQANLALISHRHAEALGLAERSVELHQAQGTSRGLAVALATLGQVFVQVGDLARAEEVLTRTLAVRSAWQFHETTGAVYDTLAQIHMMRGTYERAMEYVRLASDAYAAHPSQSMRWYEWSLRVLGLRITVRREDFQAALAMASDLCRAPGVPESEALHGELLACEALVAIGQLDDAKRRLEQCEARLEPQDSTVTWAEFLRVRGLVAAGSGRARAAHHDFAQSARVFDLLGERYQSAVSKLAVARVAATTGARHTARHYLDQCVPVFTTLGATRDLQAADAIRSLLETPEQSPPLTRVTDADDENVRRLVDAAILPPLLAAETAATLVESTPLAAAVVFTVAAEGPLDVLASAGCDEDVGKALARVAVEGHARYGGDWLVLEPLGREKDRRRWCVMLTPVEPTEPDRARYRMLTAVARQGFLLCAARERPGPAAEPAVDRKLEPLLPGFICASAAMTRLAEQIQRLQGHTLTVLITGESGTGKDLVARAIHGGSEKTHALYLPFNCTTTTRELADSHLFGHKRGAFTGAVTDQQGLIRSAAGGTLFLDEIGDLPLDIQPKLLRFLEQGEIMPVGETRPQSVNVRVLAATNADLEQRVAQGTFREDLYYRLSVIRIHVPPLRERREEIPHLATFFLRESCEQLSRPNVRLSSATLDVFARHWWPGNVRQLRNEIQRAVAMSAPNGTIEPDHLSLELATSEAPPNGRLGSPGVGRAANAVVKVGNLSDQVALLERDVIAQALGQTGRNLSEAARLLGLTRRGLYLKMSRLGLEATD
jgi:hydrogenase-4 transcriptional activator